MRNQKCQIISIKFKFYLTIERNLMKLERRLNSSILRNVAVLENAQFCLFVVFHTFAINPVKVHGNNYTGFHCICIFASITHEHQTHVKSSIQCQYLTIIARKRAWYRLLLSRRGRRLSWLKLGDITQAWAL